MLRSFISGFVQSAAPPEVPAFPMKADDEPNQPTMSMTLRCT
jgi:hypothetical protein